jgi:hypothetical protein
LSKYPLWTEPVPAERLAAFRIGLAAVLLLDVLLFYLPWIEDFYGPDGLARGDAFALRNAVWPWRWLAGLEDPFFLGVAGLAWVVAAALLLVGGWTRGAAMASWALAVAFHTLNPAIHVAGDTVRIIGLFYLMLTPCAAVWSVDAGRPTRPGVRVSPWALRLLFVQLAVIYFFNGVYKFCGPDWRGGDALHYVLADPLTARFSYAELPVPYLASRCMTWLVLSWELTFPLWMVWRRTRTVALLMGVAFHVGVGVLLELNVFSLYMLCLYLPLLPWEHLHEWLTPVWSLFRWSRRAMRLKYRIPIWI